MRGHRVIDRKPVERSQKKPVCEQRLTALHHFGQERTDEARSKRKGVDYELDRRQQADASGLQRDPFSYFTSLDLR